MVDEPVRWLAPPERIVAEDPPTVTVNAWLGLKPRAVMVADEPTPPEVGVRPFATVETVMPVLTALAGETVAVSVYGVADPVLMRQPAKVATPLPSVVTGLFVQVSVPPAPPPEPAVIDRVTELPVSGLPPASVTVTFGCCVNAVLPVAELLGCCENVAVAAGPTVMLNTLLSAAVRAPSTACNW